MLCLLSLEILNLVLAGRIGEAIQVTQKLYPGLLEDNQDLLFRLKCQQFVEMILGNDSASTDFCSPLSPSHSVSRSHSSLSSHSSHQSLRCGSQPSSPHPVTENMSPGSNARAVINASTSENGRYSNGINGSIGNTMEDGECCECVDRMDTGDTRSSG